MQNNILNMPQWLDKIKWNKDNLVAVIAQEKTTKDILMLAWMNKEALIQTLLKKQAVYWSRSRQKLWHKGEESGHFQNIHSIHLDCDGDAIIIIVTQQQGIACHTGRHTCFFNTLNIHDIIDLNQLSWNINQPILKKI